MNRKLLYLILLLFLLAPIAHAQLFGLNNFGGEEKHVQVELVSSVETIQPGVSFWVALKLDHEEHWHTYWNNPGEAGFPTTIEWNLPEGFLASEFHWPSPNKFDLGGLINYGYEGETFIPIKITPPENLNIGTSFELKGKVSYLVCKEICLPGEEDVSFELAVGSPKENESWGKIVNETLENRPKKLTAFEVNAVSSEGKISIKILPIDGVNPSPGELYFYSFEEGIIAPSAPQVKKAENGYFTLEVEVSEYLEEPVTKIKGILEASAGWLPDGPEKMWIDVSFGRTGADEYKVAGYQVNTDGSQKSSQMSLPFALFLAFVGGLILNLMPCVFPVLSLKILGFVQQAGEEKSKIRNHGLVFGFGVLVSFWVLAGLLLLLRAGGEQLGWGFQLQAPEFVISLIFVLFLLSLNLLGVFEIGTSLMGVGGKLSQKSKSGYGGSFASGILATIVATPCTAPFMGSALGFALSQPAMNSLLVFTFLAVGMASPYVFLSYFPGLLKLLPKPGPWMVSFKQFMAFPLLATIIWLMWVLGLQVGSGGVVKLLAGLLIAGFACWVFGRWGDFSRTNLTRKVALILSLVLLIIGGWIGYSGTSEGEKILENSQGKIFEWGLEWEKFSPEKVAELKENGKPLFIDFTAAWCLTCQVNKKIVFSSDEVIDRFKSSGVVAVKADWTKRNPDITEALASYKRSGVPLYVVYNEKGEFQILPEVLKPSIVLNAFDELGI